MRKIVLSILIITIVALSACETTTIKPCSEERQASAIVSYFPESIKAGTVQDVSVKFILENSCGTFDRFELTQTDKIFEVNLITKYEGCNCTLEFIEKSVDFPVDIDFPGMYEFKFWVADEEFESFVIKVFE